MLTLEVQISTFGKNGLDRVAKMILPKLERVSYFVSLQNPNAECIIIPDSLKRDDIKIVEHRSIGLSNNRNFALNNATSDIILIADDDLNYIAEGLQAVLNVFENNDDLDFATFAYTGTDEKHYPDYSFDLTKGHPKNYYISSVEIALRTDSLPTNTRFSTLMGIGSGVFGSGEENVFVWRLINKGLQGRFFPIEIAHHEGVTTGNRKPTNLVLRAQGAWLWIRFGWFVGYLRLIRDISRRHTSWIHALAQMTIGFFKGAKLFNRDGSERNIEA